LNDLRVSFLLMTKVPVIGGVKSRLGAEIGESHAAMLYRCFLLDEVETLDQLGEDYIIYYTPEDGRSLLVRLLGDQLYEPQRGVDLGERLYYGLEMARRLGYTHGVALASDVPDITVDYLRQVVEALRTRDVVVGLSSDGGYNLIGFRLGLNSRSFFTDVNWGTQTVFAETMKKLDGYSVDVLPVWSDIDVASDLSKHRLSVQSHTYRYLVDNKLI